MEQPEKMNQTSKKKTNNRNRNRHRKTNNKPTAGDNTEITTDNADTNISSSNFPKDDKKPELPITPAKDRVIASTATEEKIIQEVLVKKIAEESAKPNTLVSAVNVSKPVLKMDVKTEKSREEIMAEREAKKAAKLAAKNKSKVGPANTTAPVDQKQSSDKVASTKKPDIKVETVSKENKVKVEATTIATAEPKTTTASPKSKIEKSPSTETELSEKMEKLKLTESDKQKQKPATTKAERRAQQEAQRASKAKEMTDKQQSVESKTKSSKTEQDKKVPQVAQKQQKAKHTNDEESEKPIRTVKAQSKHRVKLFNHLYTEKFSFNENIDLTNIHPSIIKLGLQYANGIVVGSNARCMAFLNAMITVIKDFKAPVQQEYKRGLEIQIKPSLEFLHKCRPLSVSIINSLKYIKSHISQLNTKSSDEDQRDFLLDLIDTYIRDQIEKAAQAISISVQEKISNDDVILTYGCSSLIKHILEEANRRKVNFRVIVVDSRPKHEGQEMLRRLVSQGIDCTCVLINAIGFIMPEVTKVLLGAHALLANGYVTSRVGTAQIALVAKSYNVPVLVCCETHKFSERVQTDAFVYNELGDPNDLILNSGTLENKNKNHLAEWSSIPNLTPLNLYYDITPPELVTAVVTEVAILPCTSVPVILRIKPSEIGY